MSNLQYSQAPPQAPIPPPAVSNNGFPGQIGNPPPQWPRPPFQGYSLPTEQFASMKIDPSAQRTRTTNLATQKVQGEAIPVEYEGVTLKKDPNPPYGAEPSWSRVKETSMVASKDELLRMVKRKGKDSIAKDLQKLKSEKQRMQIDELLAERNHTEWSSNAEWTLAMVDEERGPGKKPNETETKALHIVLKRHSKTKSTKEAAGRRASAPAADIPGIVRDLNDPAWHGQRRPGLPQHQSQRSVTRGALPGLSAGYMPPPPPAVSGQPPNHNGPSGAPNHHLGMPPQQQQFTQPFPNAQQVPSRPPPEQFNGFQNQPPINPQNMGPPPKLNFPPQPTPPQQQQQQQQQQPPPPPPPISIPVPVHPVPGSKPSKLPKNDNDIIQIIEGSPPKRNQNHGRSQSKGSSHHTRSTPTAGKGSNVSFVGTSSDEEDSSLWSRTSEEFTNITTPTSGTGSFTRGDQKRSQSGRSRRQSGIDYMADMRDRRGSRGRRDSIALSDDFLDDYDDLSPRRNRSKPRDTRGSFSNRSPHPRARDRYISDALYKPERRPTAAELLEEEYLIRLERLRREEDSRLDQALREKDLYERERARRRHSPSRLDQGVDRSPSRHGLRY